MPAPANAAIHSDALVFFGATGDLAYEQIFPSLLGLVRDDELDVPIVGVAKSGWGLDQLKDRAKDSLARHGAAELMATTPTPERSPYCTTSSARRSGRCTIWPCRPAYSAPWPPRSRRRERPGTLAW